MYDKINDWATIYLGQLEIQISHNLKSSGCFLFFENVHLAHLVKKPEAEYLLLGFTLVKAASKVLPELVQIMQSRAPLDFVNCRV